MSATDMQAYRAQESEALFMGKVTDYATARGWQWMHIQAGLTPQGRYRTPVSGTLGPGWPDLILVRGNSLIAAELKTDHKYLNPIQKRVMTTLEAAVIECHVWRPRDWERIVERLR
jgi:hypothetical protein